jgi:hypothetical protein
MTRCSGWLGSLALAAITVAAAGAVTALAAPDQPTLTEGTIAAVNGSGFTITVGGGEKTVQVTSETLILSRQAATLASIKVGDPMGVAAKRETDGTLTAVSISIFSPELWDRARKGQWPMESGDIMTNAVVFQTVERVQGRTIYLKYNEGAAAINVPSAAAIRRLVTIRLADLKPGMHVMVRGTGNPDGTIKASSVSFDGTGHV